MKNVIQSKFSEEDRVEIRNEVNSLMALIEGKVAALNEEERLKYGSINEVNKLFVNKVKSYSDESPSLRSPDVDWVEFRADYDMRAFLESQIQSLSSVVYQLESTKKLHDYDNFQDSLIDYNYTQYKKNAQDSGYSEKLTELKQFFPRTKKSNNQNIEE